VRALEREDAVEALRFQRTRRRAGGAEVCDQRTVDLHGGALLHRHAACEPTEAITIAG